MGFMKSLFGNKGVQQEIPEYRIVITDVGPNPVQITVSYTHLTLPTT